MILGGTPNGCPCVFLGVMGFYGLLLVTLSTLVVGDVYHRIILISRDVPYIFLGVLIPALLVAFVWPPAQKSEFVDANSTSWPSSGHPCNMKKSIVLYRRCQAPHVPIGTWSISGWEDDWGHWGYRRLPSGKHTKSY